MSGRAKRAAKKRGSRTRAREALQRAEGRKKYGPSKLKRKVEETILRHLRLGAFLKHAAEAAGINYTTLKEWLDRADAGEEEYVAFAAQVRKLRAEDAIRAQAVITRAQFARVDGDYRAAIWNLERKFPNEYGQAALRAAAAVTLHTGNAVDSSEADGARDGNVTVQFYLPSNGRRPDDDEP